MLSLLIYIIVILFLVVMSMFIPIGNENSTVRRLPWVTFIIMALNVLIYYVTLPGQAEQHETSDERRSRVSKVFGK